MEKARGKSQSIFEPLEDFSFEVEGDRLVFLALGDWGKESDSVREVAETMAKWSEERAASMVLALGDNFYPSGTASTTDLKWTTVWRNQFVKLMPDTPWYAVMGNHDWKSTQKDAQVKYTRSEGNKDKLWRMPAYNYCFTVRFGAEEKRTTARFFALDTNGCQGHVRRVAPHLEHELHDYIAALKKALGRSEKGDGHWNVVFAHHPLYTKSVNHGTISDCLRDKKYYHRVDGSTRSGYQLEAALNKGAHAYLAGHEHMLQYHTSQQGIPTVVAGASGASYPRFYGGDDRKRDMHWYDETKRQNGFVCVTITHDELQIEYVNGVTGDVMCTIRKPRKGEVNIEKH